MINIEFLREYKKKEYYNNMLKNKIKKDKKAKKIINLQNKDNTIYFYKIDKVYNLSILHSKINWFKYFLEVYFVELLNKHNTIKNNKINLAFS